MSFLSFKTAVDVMGGFGSTYTFSTLRKKEIEVKQGSNHFFAAFPLIGSLFLTAANAQKVAAFIAPTLLRRSVQTCLRLSPWLAAPTLLVASVIRQGVDTSALQKSVKTWKDKLEKKESSSLWLFQDDRDLNKAASYRQHAQQKLLRAGCALVDRMGILLARNVIYVMEHPAAAKAVVDRLGSLLDGVFLVELVALALLGKPLFAVAGGAVLLFSLAEKNGKLSHKVVLFAERYFPLYANVGLFLSSSSLFIRMFVLFSAAGEVSCSMFLKQWIFLDNTLRKLARRGLEKDLFEIFFPPALPSLADCYGKMYEPASLSFETIKAICERLSDDSLKTVQKSLDILAPAHCVHAVENRQSEKAYDFATLNTYFAKVGTRNDFLSLALPRLRSDLHFLQHLANVLSHRNIKVQEFLDTLEEQIPQGCSEERKTSIMKSIDDAKTLFNEYVQESANLKEQSQEEYLKAWIAEQMQHLVLHLSDQEDKASPRTGNATDWEVGMDLFAQILFLLRSIKEKDAGSFASVVLDSAIIGGDYCARGVKKAGDIILAPLSIEAGDGQLQKKVQQEDYSDTESFAKAVLLDLLQLREEIVRNLYYNEIVQPVANEQAKQKAAAKEKRADAEEGGVQSSLLSLSGSVVSDVHGYDSYRLFFSAGFLPLSADDLQKNLPSRLQLYLWNKQRCEVFTQYRKRLLPHLQEKFQHNSSLQAALLRFLYTKMDDSRFTDEERDELSDLYAEQFPVHLDPEKGEGCFMKEEDLEKALFLALAFLGVVVYPEGESES